MVRRFVCPQARNKAVTVELMMVKYGIILDRLIMLPNSLKKLKVTVLVENTAGGKGLLGEDFEKIH